MAGTVSSSYESVRQPGAPIVQESENEAKRPVGHRTVRRAGTEQPGSAEWPVVRRVFRRTPVSQGSATGQESDELPDQ